MAARKAAWYEFMGSMPTITEEKVTLKTQNERVTDVGDKFKNGEMSETQAIAALNKLYVNLFIHKTEKLDGSIKPTDKVKMHLAYQILSGERDKATRRKVILKALLER